jgi:hypothetical protein
MYLVKNTRHISTIPKNGVQRRLPQGNTKLKKVKYTLPHPSGATVSEKVVPAMGTVVEIPDACF